MRKLIGVSGSTTVLLNGIEIAYEDTGSGAVVLCLHAVGHGGGDYVELRRRIGQKCRVIALDWPGQGASGGPDVAPDDGLYAELLGAFIERFELTDVTIIGNSIGGAAALRYAAGHPERVRALILANPGGLFIRPPGFRLFLAGMARFFDAGAAGARWYPRAFSAFYHKMLIGAPAAQQRDRIIAASSELAPLLARGWRGFAADGTDLRAHACLVKCPVLVAWATRDPINPLWMNRAAIRRFHDAKLVTFDAGHSAFLEVPDAFVAAFEAFMQGVSASRLPEVQAAG